jgi:hypothetical protein
MIGLVTYLDNQTTATLDDYANICETGYDNTKIRKTDITCYYVGDSLKINRIVVKSTYATDEYGNDLFCTEEYLDFDKDTFDHLDNRIVNIGYMGYNYIFSIKNC